MVLNSMKRASCTLLVLVHLVVSSAIGAVGIGDLTRVPLKRAVHGHRTSRKLMQQNWQVNFPYLSQGTNSSTAEGPSTPINTTECPKITLRLNTIEVYDGIVNDPAGLISVQCYTRDGQQFSSIQFYALAASVRSALGARYTPNLNIAQLSCGEEASCKISVGRTTRAWGDGGAAVSTWRELVEGGCWFDYRHFTQLSYREQMSAWTCNRPPTRYTLECVECAQADFPWDVALAVGGPPLSEEGSVPDFGFNSTMIVVSIVVCSVAVVLVGMALFVRHRRRNRESDRRVMEMIEQAREARTRTVPPGYKPPAMFVIGDARDESPPMEYKGPIVVLHCGSEEAQMDQEQGVDGVASYPIIAIAKPVVSASPIADEEGEEGPSGGAASTSSNPSGTQGRTPESTPQGGETPRSGTPRRTSSSPSLGPGGVESSSQRRTSSSRSGHSSSRRRPTGPSMSPLAAGSRSHGNTRRRVAEDIEMATGPQQP